MEEVPENKLLDYIKALKSKVDWIYFNRINSAESDTKEITLEK